MGRTLDGLRKRRVGWNSNARLSRVGAEAKRGVSGRRHLRFLKTDCEADFKSSLTFGSHT